MNKNNFDGADILGFLIIGLLGGSIITLFLI